MRKNLNRLKKYARMPLEWITLAKFSIRNYISEFVNLFRIRHQLKTHDHFKEARKFEEYAMKELAEKVEEEIKQIEYRSLSDVADLLNDAYGNLYAKLQQLKERSPIAYHKVLENQARKTNKLSQTYEEAYKHITMILALPSQIDETMVKELLPEDPQLRKELLQNPVFAELLANPTDILEMLRNEIALEFLIVLSSYERWLGRASQTISTHLLRERAYKSRKRPEDVLEPVFRTIQAMFLATMRKMEILLKIEELKEEELELLLNYAYSDLDTLIQAVHTLGYRLSKVETSQAREMAAALWS
ncbi:MAG: hypothetical protein ACE5OZ_04475 [Candidatus Heimdallarchaeota archaeon]